MTIAGEFGIAAPSLPRKSDYVADDICIGIEIEQEYANRESFSATINKDTNYTKYWRVEGDNSMRNYGVEFISSILYPCDVPAAIDTVWPHVQEGMFSWRGGIHVHVDARTLEAEDLVRVAKLYAIMEPIIFAWEGTGRDTSRFCVPWWNCPDGVEAMFASLKKGRDQIAKAFMNFGKYSALNLIPITNYGSIEFRHMTTAPEKDKLNQYVKVCMGIVEAGRRGVEADALLSSLSSEDFIKTVFKGQCDFLTKVTGYESLLWSGVDTSNSIDMSNLDTRQQNMGQEQSISYLNFCTRNLA